MAPGATRAAVSCACSGLVNTEVSQAAGAHPRPSQGCAPRRWDLRPGAPASLPSGGAGLQGSQARGRNVVFSAALKCSKSSRQPPSHLGRTLLVSLMCRRPLTLGRLSTVAICRGTAGGWLGGVATVLHLHTGGYKAATDTVPTPPVKPLSLQRFLPQRGAPNVAATMLSNHC